MAEAKRRQAHAKRFLDVAELAADDRSEGGDLEYSNASATLATLAGIAAADAACCRELGERSRGGDHHQAEQLLAQITPGGNEAAKHLRRLINLKDDAQYGFYTISGADLRRALRAAQALVKYTDDLSSRAANLTNGTSVDGLVWANWIWWYGLYMASVKATFTLDEATAARLAQTAERLKRAKSEVVREAILDYSERLDRLGERERLQLLGAFDELVPRIPERPEAHVDAELEAVRESRRGGGRRTAEQRSR